MRQNIQQTANILNHQGSFNTPLFNLKHMVLTTEEDIDMVILAIENGDYEDAIKLLIEIKEENKL